MSALYFITPEQFKTYILLVETADPHDDVARRLGISTGCLKQRTRVLFDMLGVSTRLELMMQYHYRERHPERRGA